MSHVLLFDSGILHMLSVVAGEPGGLVADSRRLGEFAKTALMVQQLFH